MVPAETVHAQAYGSEPPQAAPISVAWLPAGTNGESPASATSGCALVEATSPPPRVAVPATGTVPETGWDTWPLRTASPPTEVTEMAGDAPRTTVLDSTRTRIAARAART